jgi:hypothetical protein
MHFVRNNQPSNKDANIIRESFVNTTLTSDDFKIINPGLLISVNNLIKKLKPVIDEKTNKPNNEPAHPVKNWWW